MSGVASSPLLTRTAYYLVIRDIYTRFSFEVCICPLLIFCWYSTDEDDPDAAVILSTAGSVAAAATATGSAYADLFIESHFKLTTSLRVLFHLCSLWV